MDALDLLEARRYEESIAAYRAQIKANANDWLAIAGLACALRAAGDYVHALPLFQRVDEYERSRLPGRLGRRLDLSILYWLSENRTQAIDIMRGLVDGVLDGSIEFGDLAGGVKQGLLLHYMGVMTVEQKVIDQAVDYLRKLAKKDRINQWPGPVALYVLGIMRLEEMLATATGEPDLHSAHAAAQRDLLTRRNLCVALFHNAVCLRVKGAEQACLQRMQECCSLQDPLVEQEWYLARYEIESSRR